MGWIIAGIVGLIAAAAIGVIWRRYRHDVQQLRALHAEKVRRLGTDHHRQVDRLRREHQREMEFAHHPLARDLLPALDSLDEALTHLETTDNPTEATEEIAEGVEMARVAIDDVLRKHGISSFTPCPGEPFEPEIHEAISRVDATDEQPGTIARCFRAGYRNEERLLRAALVEVIVDRGDQSVDEGAFSNDSTDHSSPASDGEPAPPSDNSEVSESDNPNSPDELKRR